VPKWPDAFTDAACVGMPPEVFDGKTPEDVEAALAACNGCRVRRACHQWMRPARTNYDGIAGGKLWREGRPQDHQAPVDYPQPLRPL
jgi:WhiB family redox-sensing transcriptional regulator